VLSAIWRAQLLFFPELSGDLLSVADDGAVYTGCTGLIGQKNAMQTFD
jgi:hypothetical protein